MAKSRSSRRDETNADESPKTPNDAYVGLLLISFLALLVGVIMLYVDYDELSKGNAPAPSLTVSEDGLGLPAAAKG